MPIGYGTVPGKQFLDSDYAVVLNNNFVLQLAALRLVDGDGVSTAFEINRDSKFWAFDSDYIASLVTGAVGSTGLDSDAVINIVNQYTALGNLTDSDLKAVADLRNDLDSDRLDIQQLKTSTSVDIGLLHFGSGYIITNTTGEELRGVDGTGGGYVIPDVGTLTKFASKLEVVSGAGPGRKIRIHCYVNDDSEYIQEIDASTIGVKSAVGTPSVPIIIQEGELVRLEVEHIPSNVGIRTTNHTVTVRTLLDR